MDEIKDMTWEQLNICTGTYFEGIDTFIGTNRSLRRIWYCEYCKSPNPPEFTHCGQGESWGCGHPRKEEHIE